MNEEEEEEEFPAAGGEVDESHHDLLSLQHTTGLINMTAT